MKKIFTIMALCLSVMCAYAQNYTLRTLTFEDVDYVSTTPNYLGFYNWSSLIDSPQYGGDLLYGENHGDTTQQYSDVNYRWYDNGNTYLYSELPENWGTKMYWGGRHAISNYWNGNLSDGDYSHQLSVYVPNNSGNGQGGHGHNGSNNFCVHYGYHDDSGYSADNLPFIIFKDSIPRTIDHMFVNITTYLANCIVNGNDLTSLLGENDYLAIQAKGYKSDGTTSTKTFYIADGPDHVITDWTSWSLFSLGDVNKVEFNVIGSNDNGYGLSQPAYFCYDDLSVRFPLENATNHAKVSANISSDIQKCIKVTMDQGYMLSGDIPSGATYDFTSDYKYSPAYLEEGQKYQLIIKGMPTNASITAVEVVGYCEQRTGKATVHAFMGETEFASLKYSGTRVEHGIEVGQTETTMSMEMTEEMVSCTGDLTLAAECEGADMTITYYYIYYTLSDDPTGISNVIDSDNERKDNSYYSLGGTRVANPTKGLYIHNGKKILIK